MWDVEHGIAVHIEAPNGNCIVTDLGSKDGVSPASSLWNKDIGYMVLLIHITTILATSIMLLSKHDDERGRYLNWMKQNRKLNAVGEIIEERKVLFGPLIELSEKYRRKNQYE